MMEKRRRKRLSRMRNDARLTTGTWRWTVGQKTTCDMRQMLRRRFDKVLCHTPRCPVLALPYRARPCSHIHHGEAAVGGQVLWRLAAALHA